MAEKSKTEIDAEKERRELVKAGVPESAIAKINTIAIEQAKKLRPRRPNETLQDWAVALVPFRTRVREAFLEATLKEAAARRGPEKSFLEKARDVIGMRPQPFVEGDIPGQGGLPPVIGQPTGIPGQAFGIPPAPGSEPLPAALPGEAVPFALPSQAPAPPIPLGQDPNLLTPEQNGPPLPALGPQDLAPAPVVGPPLDPVTGLPPLPGLGDVPLPTTEGLPPLPPLPAESIEPAPVATPQSISLSRRMVPEATQQESQDIAEALDFISSGDPSFFDLDEGPVQELQEGPLRPPVG